MDRRGFVLVTIASVASPRTVLAQPAGKVYRIGFLGSAPASSYVRITEALRQGLRDLGWVEGRNISIEFRWAADRLERLPDLAGELTRSGVDVIVTQGTPAAIAAKKATSAIPIVFVQVGDPVGSGLVASLARPGGNMTGLTILTQTLDAKRLELLKEAIPKASRVAVLWNPDFPQHGRSLKDLRIAAQALGVDLQPVEFRAPEDFERGFAALAKKGPIVLLIMGHSMTFGHAPRLAELAARDRVPAISLYREFAQAGGLMAYGTSISYQYQHAAVYVDKILKGAKPGDLPIEQPTKFELVINLKTAKALGVAIPPSLLLRADQVIE